MRIWSLVITVFAITASRHGPRLCWNTDLAWFFRSSFISLGCCLTWTSLPHDFRLGWYSIWQDVGYDFLSATKGLAGVTSLWGGLNQWEVGDEREPRSITCLFWLHWTAIKHISSLHSCLVKTLTPSELACWAACDLPSWLPKERSAGNSLPYIVSHPFLPLLPFFLTLAALGLRLPSKILLP